MQFHPSHGEWIKILRSSGFVIDALYELYAPQDATDHPYYSLATAEWARQWPVEEHMGGTSLADVRLVCPWHERYFDGARCRELCVACLGCRRRDCRALIG